MLLRQRFTPSGEIGRVAPHSATLSNIKGVLTSSEAQTAQNRHDNDEEERRRVFLDVRDELQSSQ